MFFVLLIIYFFKYLFPKNEMSKQKQSFMIKINKNSLFFITHRLLKFTAPLKYDNIHYPGEMDPVFPVKGSFGGNLLSYYATGGIIYFTISYKLIYSHKTSLFLPRPFRYFFRSLCFYHFYGY